MIDFCIKKKIYVLNKIRLGMSAKHYVVLATKGIKKSCHECQLLVLYCCYNGLY